MQTTETPVICLLRTPSATHLPLGARRHDVKTPAKKATKATAKAPAKVVKPAKKVSAKPAAKAKSASTASAKTKAAAKPLAKAKSVEVKAPVKAAAKAVKKAPAKAPVKTAAKAPAKKGATAKAAPAKTAVAKSAVPQKPAVKAPVKAVASKVPTKAAPAKTAPVVAKAATPKTEAKPPVLAQVAAVTAAAPAAAGIPIRSSRPSARLAQITVPSMPQAVASTAAKATFLPSMSTTVLPVPTAAIKKDPKLANNWKNKPVEQLSDAEVLAMPDDEYMNDTQMAFFRLKLVQLKQGILSNAGETTEHLREDTVVVPDPADRATIEEEHALELRTRDRERKLLKKIEQSIGRIDAGDYGYCDETGEPIGVGRLLARPTATLSLEAQQRRELKQKMFGD
jgi:DnaK suppressor protein